MLKVQVALGDWLRNHCSTGVGIWQGALSAGPRFYLERPDHCALATFFFHYSNWENWVVELDAKLRATVGHPETWLALVARRFDLDRPLRFTLRLDTNPAMGRIIDLSSQELYLNGGAEIDELRRMMRMATESPTWAQVGEGAVNAIRAFDTNVRERLPDLWIVGEPENPGLEAACAKIATLRFIDANTVKTHVVMAEQLFRERKWKPAAATMRSAIEQVLQDAFVNLRTTTPTVPNANNLHEKTRVLGQHGTFSAETGRFAYGAFALLSEVGSHPGDVDVADGERAWHVGRAAVGLLADRLT